MSRKFIRLNPDYIRERFCVRGSTVFDKISGSQGGTTVEGYRFFRGKCRGYNTMIYAHAIAFFLSQGELPADDLVIDHIDGCRTNNSSDNLRAVTKSVNARNRPEYRAAVAKKKQNLAELWAELKLKHQLD